MVISVKDVKEYNGKKFFTVSIDGTDIKGCKVVAGQKGDFVSGPAKKIQKDGKDEWINLVWFSKEHQAEILKLVGATKPAQQQTAQTTDDIPFN